MDNQLQTLRQSIDGCDQQIISQLAQRVNLVKQVGEYKKARGLPPLDQARWNAAQQVRLDQAAQLGLDATLTEKIFNLIHEHALNLEEQR